MKKSKFDKFYDYSMSKKRFFAFYEKEIVISVLASLIVLFLVTLFELLDYLLINIIARIWIILIKFGLIFIFVSAYVNYVNWFNFLESKKNKK